MVRFITSSIVPEFEAKFSLDESQLQALPLNYDSAISSFGASLIQKTSAARSLFQIEKRPRHSFSIACHLRDIHQKAQAFLLQEDFSSLVKIALFLKDSLTVKNPTRYKVEIKKEEGPSKPQKIGSITLCELGLILHMKKKGRKCELGNGLEAKAYTAILISNECRVSLIAERTLYYVFGDVQRKALIDDPSFIKPLTTPFVYYNKHGARGCSFFKLYLSDVYNIVVASEIPLESSTRWEIFLFRLESLKKLHDRGIVDRDVKSENILIHFEERPDGTMDFTRPQLVCCDLATHILERDVPKAIDWQVGSKERFPSIDVRAQYNEDQKKPSDIYAMATMCDDLFVRYDKQETSDSKFATYLKSLMSKENPEERPKIDTVITLVKMFLSRTYPPSIDALSLS